MVIVYGCRVMMVCMGGYGREGEKKGWDEEGKESRRKV